MILEVKNGGFSYRKGEPMLWQGIDFKIQSGDLMAILGPNGAGKTTLLRCIMGLLKWREGGSFLDGKNIDELSYRQLWSKVAYVPQAKHTSAAYSVEEMVLLGRSSHFNMWQKPTKRDMDLVDKILEDLQIQYLKGKSCGAISGGELQMVLIAKALISEPEILILDEPESNLDFRNQLIVLETMSKLAADGMACLFNTHYPLHALQRANKAMLLCKGGEYRFGDTVQVICEDSIRHAFGVDAVIGDIETPEKVLSSIVPLKISENRELSVKEDGDAEQIAVISIINNDVAMAEKINNILHEYNRYIIGRMGLPYRKKHMNVINITFDAPRRELERLTQKLNTLQGISVKTTYAPRGEFDE